MKRTIFSLVLIALLVFSIYAFAVGGAAGSALGAQSGANNEAGGVTVLSSAGASASNTGRYDIGTPKVMDIWVDAVRGSDSNSGTTRALALATFEAAWNRIPERTTLTTTGYRIMLGAGSYRERMPPNGWMESRYGTYQCPVIIQSADGVGAARLSNVDMFDCRYTYLIGVRIEASGSESGDALHLAGCNHILVRQVQAVGTGDIYAYASPQEALKANQCQYVYIEDSDISGAWGNALDYVAVQYGHIAGSRIHHSLDWCVCLKGGSASLLIEGNEIYESSTGGFTAGQGTGFEYMVSPWLHYEAYDLKFINNVIHDIDGASGVGVNGGYNILLAYNTLYRVGKTDNTMEFVHGLRGCGAGDAAACAANLKAGGWGTVRTGSENQQPIPNRNVFVYNNIVYNPPGYQTQWQQFAFAPPQTPASDSNIPSPSRADTNLQIRGNIIWNGPPYLPLSGDYVPSTPTCNADQLVRDNAINTLQPQLVDPAYGNFRPALGGNVFAAKVFPIPRFAGGDQSQPPLAPQGDLNNAVTYDYSGMPRTSTSPPGAFTATVKKLTTFTIATSTTTPTTNVPFTFSGTLKSGTVQLTNQPVHLERRTGTTGTWANVAGTYKYTDGSGKVAVSQTISTAGTYQYRWHYNGTATYQGAYSAALTETVKAQTQITLAASTTTPAVGQTITITVNLKAGSTLLSKSVKIWHTTNGVRWEDGTHNTASGVYSFTQAFGSTGQRVYHAEFAGDSTYGASSGTVTVNVGMTPTTATLTASKTNPTIGQSVTFTVNLKAGSNGLSKSVKVWHSWPGGARAEDGTFNTVNGVYSFTQAFGSTGQRIYHAEFAGDSTYGASSSSVTVNVATTPTTATTTTITASPTNPAVGSAVTLTITVKAGSTVLTNKQVTVMHTYPSATTPGKDGVFDTGSTGTTTFSATYGSVGQRVYTAAFAGDSQYAASSGTVTVNVGTTPTHITITASPTTPSVGQSVIFTVTMSGSTGSKSVKIWHSWPGGIGQDGTHTTTNGVYAFTQVFGTTGQRVYHAEFAGDSTYASSSGTVTINVQ